MSTVRVRNCWYVCVGIKYGFIYTARGLQFFHVQAFEIDGSDIARGASRYHAEWISYCGLFAISLVGAAWTTSDVVATAC